MGNKGFTLIEILLVVAILGLIVGKVVPNLVGRGEKAKVKIAQTDIYGGLSEVLDLYELDNGNYPNSLQDLYVKPSNADGWSGPYIKKNRMPVDPWGNPYHYRYPGIQNSEGYDLFSSGKDGAEGTDDDITNWGEVV